MWILHLNDMRGPKYEITEPVCRANTREALEELVARETVELYRDGRFAKTFRAGGPLEWYNRPAFGGGNYQSLDLDEPLLRLRGLARVLRGAMRVPRADEETTPDAFREQLIAALNDE